MKQIYEQVESTSFDTPDSWEKELRARRVSLRNDQGLVVQGSRLQRGWQLPNLGPANSGGEWINLFDDEAPVASEFSFLPEAHGIRTSSLQSVDTESYAIYHFRRQVLSPSRMLLSQNRQQTHTEKTPCK